MAVGEEEEEEEEKAGIEDEEGIGYLLPMQGGDALKGGNICGDCIEYSDTGAAARGRNAFAVVLWCWVHLRLRLRLRQR